MSDRNDRLAEIKKRLAGLNTPGPWAVCNYGEKCHSIAVGIAWPQAEGWINPPNDGNDPDITDEVCWYEGATGGTGDMTFIAYAPSDGAWLIEELERAQAALGEADDSNV